jgi:hypothetical protein
MYQSPFPFVASSVSTTVRNSLRAPFGSSSLRAESQWIAKQECAFCIVVAIFYINIWFFFVFVFVDEIIINYNR